MTAQIETSSALAIFSAAMRLAEPARAAFVELACQEDEALRKKVQALIEMDQSGGPDPLGEAHQNLHPGQAESAKEENQDRFEPEEDDIAATSIHSSEAAYAGEGELGTGAGDQSGERIGPYKLLQQIGEGGFGTVYMAKQTSPVRRKVALKIIKAGMDSKEVLARFEAEKQALALMDHPNIAKVLDAGTTSTGRPYFVMELVHGTRITDFCDENRQTTRQRLALLVDVCRAVQHAHMKGIIHRDLKPSNVLVTMSDGQPMVKVIDFGVSKALHQDLTDATVFTAYGQLVGTPMYMSPEQAQFSAHDIDVRSDVYSLGVILYELLTGQTPFDREQLRASGFDEMRRILREVDPPRPSDRVSTLRAEMLSTVSDRRQLPHHQIARSLVGELDWIVMKALSKERDRRYQSASEFATDIQHFLDDDPVKARPPSKRYLLGKFARRHRVALTTSTVVLLALVVGFSGAVWQAAVARREKSRAEREASISAAVNEFLNEDLLAQANPENQSDPDVKLRTVIDQAAEKLETRFRDQPLVEAAIRHTLAETYISLAEDRKAQKEAERAAELRGNILGKNDQATLDSALLVAKALSGQGDYLASQTKTKDIVERAQIALGTEHRLTLEAGRQLGRVLIWLAKYDEAQETLSQVLRVEKQSLGDDDELTLRTLATISQLHVAQGRYDEAALITREVIKIRRRLLGAEHPHTLGSMHSLGVILARKGEYAEAKSVLRDCLESRRRIFGKSSLEATGTEIDIAIALRAEGRIDEAIAIVENGLAHQEKERGKRDLRTLAAKENLANLLKDTGKRDEALELLTEVANVRQERLGDEHPDTLHTFINLATVHFSQYQYREAEEILDKVVPVARRTLGAMHPATDGAVYNLATIYIFTDRLSQAERILKAVVDARTQALGVSHPMTMQANEALAVTYNRLGQHNEAEKVLDSLVAACTKALGPEHRTTLSSKSNLGAVYVRTSRWGEAERVFKEISEIARTTDTNPNSLIYMYNWAIALRYQNLYDEAAFVLRELIEFGTETWGEGQRDVIDARDELAFVYSKQGRIDDQEEIVRENLDIKRRVLGEDHSDTNSCVKQLRTLVMRRSESLVLSEKFEEALEVLSEIAELSPAQTQAVSLVGLQLHSGPQNKAGELSQQLWERAKVEEGGPVPTSRWVLAALLSPHHGLDSNQVVEFMQPILAEQNGHLPRLALGLAHYRSGNFAEAAETVATNDAGAIWARPIISFVHAMACAELGNVESAKKSFDEAIARMNAIAPTPNTGVDLKDGEPPRWALWCLYQGLKREATEALEIEIESKL